MRGLFYRRGIRLLVAGCPSTTTRPAGRHPCPRALDRGETLPILAARSFQPECLRLLIAAGVDVGATLDDGCSAVLAAVLLLLRDFECVEILSQAGCSFDGILETVVAAPCHPEDPATPLSSKPAWTPVATWSMAPSRGAKFGVCRPRPTPTPHSPNVALCERLLADAEFLPICLDWPPQRIRRPAFDRSKPRTWLAFSTQGPRRLVDRRPLHRALDHGHHLGVVFRVSPWPVPVSPWPVPCVEQRVDAH